MLDTTFGGGSGHDGPDTGDSDIHYILTWTSTSSEILIQYAAHISPSLPDSGITPYGWGAGQGASAISGGPYHNNLSQLNDTSLGSQENQLKGADLIQPSSITIIKDTEPGEPNLPQDFGYLAGPPPLSAAFMLDDDGDGVLDDTIVFANILDFGLYTVMEETPIGTGWTLTNIVCSGGADITITGGDANAGYQTGDDTVNIDLTEGEDVICTFTNTISLTPDVATDIHNTAHSVVLSVEVGTTVHDSATVTTPSSTTGTPDGTVFFKWFENGACTGDPEATSDLTGDFSTS